MWHWGSLGRRARAGTGALQLSRVWVVHEDGFEALEVVLLGGALSYDGLVELAVLVIAELIGDVALVVLGVILLAVVVGEVVVLVFGVLVFLVVLLIHELVAVLEAVVGAVAGGVVNFEVAQRVQPLSPSLDSASATDDGGNERAWILSVKLVGFLEYLNRVMLDAFLLILDLWNLERLHLH